MFESRLRAVVDTAIDGIILMDAEGAITMFNPACERMFDYSASEVVGGDVEQLIPSLYRNAQDQYPNPPTTGRREITGFGREVVGRRRNGDTFPLDFSVGESRQGEEVFFVGILRDVTESKRSDALREQFIEELTASNAERSHFVHVASHDLREPLRMATAFCGRLSSDYRDRLDDRGREYLSLVQTAANQMTLLLDDLTDFGRLGFEAERGCWFSAEDQLKQVLEIFNDPIMESGAIITHDPLPPIYGNPIRFQRVIQNLIGNGLKFVAPGVGPRIHVAVARSGEFWHFSIRDNGIGIDPRHYDRIFEPFKRLHAKSRYYGTGLGLAICRKIIEAFGGTISVRSEEGWGATFDFTVRIQGEENSNGRSDD